MPTKPLTKRQKKLFGFIARYRTKHGFSPTVREMATALGTTITPAYAMIRTMERNGHVHIEPMKDRGVTLLLPEEAK